MIDADGVRCSEEFSVNDGSLLSYRLLSDYPSGLPNIDRLFEQDTVRSQLNSVVQNALTSKETRFIVLHGRYSQGKSNLHFTHNSLFVEKSPHEPVS